MKCLRCGQCCRILYKGKILDCQYLIRFKNGTTKCRVYKQRIGKQMHGNIPSPCGMRKDSPYDYKNCPFNTDKPNFAKVQMMENILK